MGWVRGRVNCSGGGRGGSLTDGQTGTNCFLFFCKDEVVEEQTCDFNPHQAKETVELMCDFSSSTDDLMGERGEIPGVKGQ